MLCVELNTYGIYSGDLSSLGPLFSAITLLHLPASDEAAGWSMRYRLLVTET